MILDIGLTVVFVVGFIAVLAIAFLYCLLEDRQSATSSHSKRSLIGDVVVGSAAHNTFSEND